jgi:signal transduction histidine kinase
MKIRNRLTLSFSLAIIGFLLIFSFTVYFFSTSYRKSEFNNRLKQRIEITEKIFLEQTNAPDDFARIQEQFLNKLPEETEEVVEMTDNYRDQLTNQYPLYFLNAFATQREAFFQEEDVQGGGKIFHVNGRDYLVLLTAVDYIGIRMMDHLITVLVIVMTVCILGITLLSHYISSTLINPISAKIRQANAISANNLSDRLDVISPDDEMGELAAAFNSLLDRLEQAFYTQKLFIDNASHEIRNPLTAIMGETEFALAKPRSAEELIDSLKSVSRESDRLNSLVNDLLQLAGINQKEITFSREVITVNELVAGALEKLAYVYPHNRVEMDPSTVGSAREIFVEGNRHLLITAFYNLLDNACKYSSFQPVSIKISTTDSQSVEVAVLDHGIGIPQEDLRNITQPFHRASNVRQIHGTGIGIPLTLKIIELHGGKLAVQSTLSSGTIAKISLPTSQAEILI